MTWSHEVHCDLDMSNLPFSRRSFPGRFPATVRAVPAASLHRPGARRLDQSPRGTWCRCCGPGREGHRRGRHDGRRRASAGAVTGERAAAAGMVRAGRKAGVAPGFRADAVIGARLRLESDLRLPVHGPASGSRAGHLLPRSQAGPGGTSDRNRRPGAVRPGTGYRTEAAGKGKQHTLASRIVPKTRPSVHGAIWSSRVGRVVHCKKTAAALTKGEECHV